MERSHDNQLLTITTGKQVIFLNLDTQEPYLSHTLNYSPSTASIHPISRDRFITGSADDGWVRVIDAKSGKEREVYKGHHGPVHCVSYTPDGEMYASASEDGTIRLWQTEPNKPPTPTNANPPKTTDQNGTTQTSSTPPVTPGGTAISVPIIPIAAGTVGLDGATTTTAKEIEKRGSFGREIESSTPPGASTPTRGTSTPNGTGTRTPARVPGASTPTGTRTPNPNLNPNQPDGQPPPGGPGTPGQKKSNSNKGKRPPPQNQNQS